MSARSSSAASVTASPTTGLRFELQGAFYENKINKLKNGGFGNTTRTSGRR